MGFPLAENLVSLRGRCGKTKMMMMNVWRWILPKRGSVVVAGLVPMTFEAAVGAREVEVGV